MALVGEDNEDGARNRIHHCRKDMSTGMNQRRDNSSQLYVGINQTTAKTTGEKKHPIVDRPIDSLATISERPEAAGKAGDKQYKSRKKLKHLLMLLLVERTWEKVAVRPLRVNNVDLDTRKCNCMHPMTAFDKRGSRAINYYGVVYFT
ncbi:hypothetical protein H6P81_019866 [Aristolochia fimbriata]|uniref:Uncharacterized protein n=1 Tax=Aristolochia fimbriata TaxID=158543 RepID=A0AAV7DU64_ARIFI|nr:hypothetical protein H6P81_019866 [Aristolochia fimbriata]